MALASLMNLSIPNKKANPSIGIFCKVANVLANTINPLPVTPAAPLEVNMSIKIIVTISDMLNGTLYNCAINITAIDRYIDVPSKLKE